ncbi:hypothetical protein BB561_005332 [Smittium simulii]|uniref:Restriction endonuclease type IV Mrr domain-containing protein n=1 Tax=Smittium simulii TaxID=133385 RepID=A0A2T9YAW0_9FUNG|nr:hypothetical protein BB561_005332 [Smittium simulii]
MSKLLSSNIKRFKLLEALKAPVNIHQRTFKKAAKNTLSTYEVGTRYEELVISTISHIRCTVKGLGGANDSGIDFLGNWNLSKKTMFSVVGQCKNYQDKLVGPSVIREFEGVMSRQDPFSTIGIIAAPLGFTKNAIETMMSSNFPICLLIVNFDSLECARLTKDQFESKLLTDIAWEKIKQGDTSKSNRGVIKGLFWNVPASILLKDLIVTTKYTRKNLDTSIPKEVSIIYKKSMLY